MADAMLLRALKGQPKNLSLANKELVAVPRVIGRLQCLTGVNLKSNKITSLPKELGFLSNLTVLNLGNNLLEELPEPLGNLHSLETLHLFNNKITTLNTKVLGGLRNLILLNLNNNQLKMLPAGINKLTKLQSLSVDGNKLTVLPSEMCALSNLQELHAANNLLMALPLEMGFLVNLRKLFLQQNRIKELPEGLGKLYKLRVIDIAANDLRIFPTELNKLPLRELYSEENPLLQQLPVHSVQEEEILSLKEIVARYILKELKDRRKLVRYGDQMFWEENEAWSYLRKALRHYPNVRDMLAQASKCALCGESFLNTWLECVRFVDVHKELKTSNSTGVVPVRALLCSYKCFNSPGHDFFGVAFP